MSETWIINEIPSVSTNIDYSITFVSNNITFSTFGFTYLNTRNWNIHYDNEVACYREDSPAAWNLIAYRTVVFETAPTGDLLTWLESNAVKQ